MQKSFLKGIAIVAAISIGALAAAPRARAHDNDLPAAIAGIAIGAVIASQAAKRHRHDRYYEHRYYEPRYYQPRYYRPTPHAYAPRAYGRPPSNYRDHGRHKSHAKPVKRQPKSHAKPVKRQHKRYAKPSYYPPARHPYNGGRRVPPLRDIPDPERDNRTP